MKTCQKTNTPPTFKNQYLFQMLLAQQKNYICIALCPILVKFLNLYQCLKTNDRFLTDIFQILIKFSGAKIHENASLW